MLVVSNDYSTIFDANEGTIAFWLDGNIIRTADGHRLGTYKTSSEAQAAFKDLIEQLDEHECMVVVK